MTAKKKISKKRVAKKKSKKKTTRKNPNHRGGAPKGNQFWKARSSHGRKPIFETPDQLWDAAYEYFDWIEANPLKEMKVFHAQGIITKTEVPKMRPMTIAGLCIFLDISQMAWGDYCKKQDFSYVTDNIKDIIRTQKFEGAAADLLNHNIIARDLGLRDQQEHTGSVSVTLSKQDAEIL